MRGTQAARATGIVADGKREIGLQRQVERLVWTRLRLGRRDRQVDVRRRRWRAARPP